MKAVKILLLFFSIAFIFPAVWFSINPIQLSWKGEYAKGVIDSVIISGGAYDEGLSYYYQYSFNVGDSVLQKGKTIMGGNDNYLKLGDIQEIVFLKENPNINSINSFKQLYLGPVISFGIGITVFIIWCLIRKRI